MQELSDVQFVAWFAGAVDGGWEPLEGGQWEADDAWASLVPGAPPMSGLVADLASTASAMQEAVLALAFVPEDEQPSNVIASHMVMVRSAIECLATGLWLCLPKDSEERAKRYLALGYQDVSDLLGTSGGPRSPLPKEGIRLLTEMGVDVESRISATQIIRAADIELGTDTLMMWRLYSGVAHGRPWARNVTRTSFPAPESEGARISQALRVLAPGIELARSLLEVADLRRRFPHPTALESERLERLRSAR
ncbi:hypothetical protein G7075_16555 [Phycicoccus sp. HDW14]|uniref:hypothetical protein n=1 Tax=Phycicoccus sp. HDW14 TaxID=2714941 RepID=UPI00140E5EEA|nr:hypothetical protein [Phycicoccus sp. HDW14]QIM22376.1 hypothetical protein G7075_16555 [Phycicoccus sp. HDW14]